MSVMQSIPDGAVDMILCDLPYNLTANKWDKMLPLPALWEIYLRVLKQTGVVALNASQPFSSMLVMSNLKMFRHEWIWIKAQGSNFLNTVREPMKEHEHVLIFSRGKWTYNKQMQERSPGGLRRIGYARSGDNYSSNYRRFTRGRNQTVTHLRVPSSHQSFANEKGLHPTQKPVALCEYLIRTYTNEGETVLDNCMGSGSTGVACVNTNRHFIGIEKDEAYFAIAQSRIQSTPPPPQHERSVCALSF